MSLFGLSSLTAYLGGVVDVRKPCDHLLLFEALPVKARGDSQTRNMI